jgi:hypothetical protein
MNGFSPAKLKSGIGPDYICKRLCPLRHPPDFVFVPLSIPSGFLAARFYDATSGQG